MLYLALDLIQFVAYPMIIPMDIYTPTQMHQDIPHRYEQMHRSDGHRALLLRDQIPPKRGTHPFELVLIYHWKMTCVLRT